MLSPRHHSRPGAALLALVLASVALPTHASAARPPTAYVVNEQSGTVTPIDLETRRPGPPIAVGPSPESIAITPDGKTAYVTNFDATVTPIDLATDRPGRPIRTVASQQEDIAIAPDGRTAYVVDEDDLLNGTVTPIDLVKGIALAPILVAKLPTTIAITPNGKSAYVVDSRSSALTPITLATGRPRGALLVAKGITSIAIAPNGATAYVTDVNGTVTPINLATLVAAPAIHVRNAVLITLSPSGKTALVDNPNADTVTPIDLETRKPGAPIRVGSDPLGIAFAPSGQTAYVVNDTTAGTVTPIDLRTDKAGTPIRVGASPTAIAIAP